jgi:hypothetical protein
MLDTVESCENVACNAEVDFTTSQSARSLFLSPNSFVRIVTVANALGSVCDVGRTKKWVISPLKSRGSRFTNNDALKRTGVSEVRDISKWQTDILTEINREFVV